MIDSGTAGRSDLTNSDQKLGSEPFVSVVTPFYNTRDFLPECIESVLRQTYQNWEYVLVDNCSTDGSSEIAAEYAARFPTKIRLIRTSTFLSQVQNYNCALSCISTDSKYCKMVQADDWIFPECIREMVEVAEAHPAVGIVGAYELEGDVVSLDGLPYPSPEVTGREACRLYFLKGHYLFGTPTSLLMRSDLICSRNPFYEELYAPFEDAHACFDLLRNWKFGFVHQVLTYSRRGNESMLSGIGSFGHLLFSRLAFVVEYGHHYLSLMEYERCLRDAEREYFLFLGKSALKGREQRFWEFHRNALGSIGYSLNWQRLGKSVPLAILEYIGNPKRTLDAVWAKLSNGAIFEWRQPGAASVGSSAKGSHFDGGRPKTTPQHGAPIAKA